jgi:hypothetical protein
MSEVHFAMERMQITRYGNKVSGAGARRVCVRGGFQPPHPSAPAMRAATRTRPPWGACSPPQAVPPAWLAGNEVRARF